MSISHRCPGNKKWFQVIFKGNTAIHKNGYLALYFKTKDVFLKLI